MPLATFKVSISDHLFVQPFPSSVRTPFTFLHLLPNTVNLVEPGGGSPQLGRCGDWEVRMPALGPMWWVCQRREAGNKPFSFSGLLLTQEAGDRGKGYTWTGQGYRPILVLPGVLPSTWDIRKEPQRIRDTSSLCLSKNKRSLATGAKAVPESLLKKQLYVTSIAALPYCPGAPG